MVRTVRTWWLAGALALVFALPLAAGEKLTLRINDVVAVPGGKAAIVLRTYASRPIEQGQLCLEAKPVAAAQKKGPVQSTRDATVFSDQQDTQLTFSADLTGALQTFVVQFNSPTATINSSDGPLAVLLVDLDDTLLPGQVFDLRVDLLNTYLFDENGNPIEIRPRAGTMTIRDPAAPVTVGVESEDVSPGQMAHLSFRTMEHMPLSSGRVGFQYDATIAAGPPTVTIDPRYGQASYSIDASVPGRAIVDFESPDGSLNTIPGSIIQLNVPTLDSVLAGTVSPISLGGSVFLTDTAGTSPALTLESDVLVFVEAVTTAPGEAVGLRLGKAGDGMLSLQWSVSCGQPDGYSLYRGDLAAGYDSLVPAPGGCDLPTNQVEWPMGASDGELFLVVPHRSGLAGGYGATDPGDPRTPLLGACYPPAIEAITTVCDPDD